MVKFIPLKGDDLGVYHNENYLIVQTLDGDITFSYTRKGNGMDCHFAASREGLRALKNEINIFCEMIFNKYRWCQCIFAVVSRKSVERLIKKCGFKLMATDEKQQRIYMRGASWAES